MTSHKLTLEIFPYVLSFIKRLQTLLLPPPYFELIEITFASDIQIDGGKLFKCAYEVNRMFTFEYKAKKVHMKLRVSDNSWINDVIKIIESSSGQGDFYKNSLPAVKSATRICG